MTVHPAFGCWTCLCALRTIRWGICWCTGNEDDWEDQSSGAGQSSDELSTGAHQNRLQMQTSDLLTRAIPEAMSSIQEASSQPVKELHAVISEACRRVSSAIGRQSRDRVGGRFFMPEIIEAAQTHPTERDYASEEDNIAVYVPSSRSKRAAFRVGLLDASHKLQRKGARQSRCHLARFTSWT